MHERTYVQPYSMRVSIDLDLRVGSWYIVRTIQGTEACTVHWQKDMLELCEPKILAFDIECEKAGNKYTYININISLLTIEYLSFLLLCLLSYIICILFLLTTLTVDYFHFNKFFTNNHHDFYFLFQHSFKVP